MLHAYVPVFTDGVGVALKIVPLDILQIHNINMQLLLTPISLQFSSYTECLTNTWYNPFNCCKSLNMYIYIKIITGRIHTMTFDCSISRMITFYCNANTIMTTAR